MLPSPLPDLLISLREEYKCHQQATLTFSSRVWDPQSGECLNVLSHNHIVKAVAFPVQRSPQVIATGGQEKKLRIWDLTRSSSSPVQTNGASTQAPTTLTDALEVGVGDHTASIKSIVWNVDYNVLTTASDDKTIRWYDLRAEGPISTYKTEKDITSCELSTNQAEDMNPGVLSVAAGTSAYFFDAGQPGQLLKKVDFDHGIASVAYHGSSQGTQRFVTGGSNDTWVRVWDFEPERLLGMSMPIMVKEAGLILQILSKDIMVLSGRLRSHRMVIFLQREAKMEQSNSGRHALIHTVCGANYQIVRMIPLQVSRTNPSASTLSLTPG